MIVVTIVHACDNCATGQFVSGDVVQDCVCVMRQGKL